MVSYEESRQKRVEENKKRMEQLNLHSLSQSLKHSPSKTPRPLPLSGNKVRNSSSGLTVTSVRRSSRTADKPPPNYKEDPLGALVGRRSYRTSRREPRGDIFASAEERAESIERADYLESTLGSEFPTFVKPMLHSHVSGGFWLSLPRSFCHAHMPDEDITVSLIDEDNDQWEAKYLAYKNGLSGGWRTFSMDHQLIDGDALVFQLVDSHTFRVYIIRIGSIEPLEQEGDEGDTKSNEVPTATEVSGSKGAKPGIGMDMAMKELTKF